MDGTHFPITETQLLAQLETYSEGQIQQYFAEGYQVSRVKLNHPGETWGFRADLKGRSVVYIPDNEINPPYPPVISDAALTDFCAGADVLIHDAQYLDGDMPLKRGWGHSLLRDVWALARAARVGHLVLFHHDPDRTDAELDAIQLLSDRWFAENAPEIRCTVAYEGLEIRLTAVPTESVPDRFT